jgi:nitrite reductase/ring-hydroxylating ferredoxin subunit
MFALTWVVLLQKVKLEEYIVQCPWHGSRFDNRSGEVVMPPAMRPESTYEVKVENNNIINCKTKSGWLVSCANI